jgi:type I restriction enzyme S subunit
MNIQIQHKTKYKNSPLGLIPEDWEIKLFSEVFDYINTPSFSRENLTYDETEKRIKYIHYGDIHSTYKNELLDVVSEIIPYLKDEFVNEDKFNFLKEGDLIIADASEDYEGVGECIEIKNIGNEKIIGGLHTIVARGKDNLTQNGFKTYILNSHTVAKSLKVIATGTSVYGVSKGNLSKINLPIPPLPEQTAIANCLSTWDKAIATQTQLIAQKEMRKKALMQQLLSGKKRLKGFSGEWKEVMLKDVFTEIKETNDGELSHTVMTISSKLGLISQHDKFDRVIAGDSLKKYTLIKNGDFAYNKGNSKTYQMGCVFQLEELNSALVPFVYICFKPSNNVCSTFYKHWFSQHGLDSQLQRIITSGARGDGLLNVNTIDFFKLKIIFPTKKEQTAIANILQCTDEEIQLLKKKLQQLKDQKKKLMQVLLTGKQRLKY